ncbi:protein-S-isoprenylcysteine O-methyltransferase [Pseudahrensia aquimaris]|uniref:Protein-S-isoprenylcysteine O-methyltransferase n=1 Tax=Pseudahrensia aquimaris TaxID=744461 RepID=A0ABW3FAL1_9HYPH
MEWFSDPRWAHIVWALGLAAWWGIRLPRRRAAKRSKVIKDKVTVGERVALSFNITALALVPAIGLATDWLDFADYPFVPVLAVLGALALIAFLALFYLSHKQLGKNWSVTLEVRENHSFVRRGLYARMRHPMYTSFWLWGISQALLLNNWIYGPIGLLSIAWLYFSRVSNEEAMMREQFGEEYDAYCAVTPRVVPRIF